MKNLIAKIQAILGLKKPKYLFTIRNTDILFLGCFLFVKF